ncbi:aldo/keto reductase [Tsukamurella soli]|uniref:Aldo/keto reductase n=1 Tax=Tsukamurella soli TaxID=644556 RepID=A0ABP8KHC2_9ACTN
MTDSIADRLPLIGLGTWPFTGARCTDNVLAGLDTGYRLIDTAAKYENEDAVGAALARSGLPRGEYVVTTKLRGRDHIGAPDGTPSVRVAVEQSLERLGLDRVDLLLIHWPLPRRGRYVAAYEQLLACRDAGLIRWVGVSNFLGRHLQALVGATGEAPALNQIQMDPTIARTPVRADDDALGVLTQSWSPLGRGDALDDPAIAHVAEEHAATPAQIVLAWHLAHGVRPVVRTSNAARQRENLAATGIRLTDADVAALDALDRGESAARDVETHEEF